MANNNAGTLRARLGLDPSQFNRGLDGARAKARGFSSRIVARMAAVGVAMAAATTAGLGAMARNSLTFVDAQAKVARTIDGSIDGLRALQIAAGDAGVAEDELNRSMQEMSARLVEAEVKGGGAADAVARLGLNAKELSKMDSDERLAAIADRVKTLGLSSSQTTQFLMEMGVNSKEMALLLKGGGDAIRAARKEVDDLGLALSSVDAAKVENANDALSRIGLVTEALGNRLAIAFAPALESVATGFTNLMREGGLFRTLIDTVSDSMDRILSYLGAAAGLLAGRLLVGLAGAALSVASLSRALVLLRGALIRTGIGALVVGAGELVYWFSQLVKGAGGFGNALGLLKDVALEVWDRIKTGIKIIPAAMKAGAAQMYYWFVQRIRDMAGAFVDFTWAIAEGLNSLFNTNLSGLSGGLNDELWEIESAAGTMAANAGAALGELSSAVSAPLTSLKALKAAVSDTTEETKDGADAADRLADALNNIDPAGAGGGASGPVKKIEEVKTAVEKLTEKLKETKSAMQSAFTSFVTGSKSAREAVLDLLRSFAQMAANKLFDRLWSAGLGALTGGKLFGGSNSVAAKLIPGFANGTNFAPGGLAMVGERGRELVNLPRGSQVIPNHRLASSGIGGPAEVRVLGGDLTLTDDGKIAARIQISGQQSVAQSVQTVRSSLHAWQQQLNADGVLA